MGEQMSDNEISDMMAFLDPENTGRVSYQDFLDVRAPRRVVLI